MTKIVVSVTRHVGENYLTSPTIKLSITDFTLDENGHIHFTPELKTAREIDENANQLIQQIEIVRNQAKEVILKHL